MNGQSTNALVGPLDAAQRHGWQSRFQTAATARAVGEVKHIPKHGRKEPVMKKQETKSINEVAGSPSAVAYSDVQRMIVKVRNQHVIIDADVAKLYGVETKRINEAVHNNPDKFPADYMFVLTSDESKTLRSKISSLEQGGKGRHSKYNYKAFTENPRGSDPFGGVESGGVAYRCGEGRCVVLGNRSATSA